MSNLSSVIEKVKKLQALGSSSNQNEANAAMAAANKLIDAHRLTENDLSVDSEESIDFDDTYVYETGKITAWKSSLACVLAAHYGCAIYNDGTKASGRLISRLKLVGRKSDREIVRYFFSFLTTECARLAESVKGTGRVQVASFCMGFVEGIRDQLTSSRKAVVVENHSTGLVKLEARTEESNAYMKSKLKLGKGTASKAQLDSDAYHSGKTAGASTHLGAALPGKTRLLGM